MTTISQQEFEAIVAKPGPLWADAEARAFWAYMETLEDREERSGYLQQVRDTRRAYHQEHPDSGEWRPLEEWSDEERAAFEVQLNIEMEQDGYVFDGERWVMCSDARPMAPYCWSQGCGHLADDHDTSHPNAACAVAGCPCTVLVRPRRLAVACICGQELWQHLDLEHAVPPGTTCQFTAATPAIVRT